MREWSLYILSLVVVAAGTALFVWMGYYFLLGFFDTDTTSNEYEVSYPF